ncbi:hypothetical protein NPIL_681971 [Nephila pilipes]|uniref:Uncharacterized protein n=1 Tax=Nephila pilipes TaxID=299642 RepID=A0A8X6QBE2_NEPPI|nr:hypothetical protein NPIL_681971 [Nephila pilipes]
MLADSCPPALLHLQEENSILMENTPGKMSSPAVITNQMITEKSEHEDFNQDKTERVEDISITYDCNKMERVEDISITYDCNKLEFLNSTNHDETDNFFSLSSLTVPSSSSTNSNQPPQKKKKSMWRKSKKTVKKIKTCFKFQKHDGYK